MPATAARISLVSERRRTALNEDATIKSKNEKAREVTIDTLLAGKTDAETEAARQWAIVKARRQRYVVRLGGLRDDIEVGDTVTLKLSRFGLSAGKDFLVTGVSKRFGANETVIRVYG